MVSPCDAHRVPVLHTLDQYYIYTHQDATPNTQGAKVFLERSRLLQIQSGFLPESGLDGVADLVRGLLQPVAHVEDGTESGH